MAAFEPDHFIEEIRGEHRLPPSRVRAIAARRAAWLYNKIAELDRSHRECYAHHLDELIALLQLVEAYEEKAPTVGVTFAEVYYRQLSKAKGGSR
jgi:hypothetical protein